MKSIVPELLQNHTGKHQRRAELLLNPSLRQQTLADYQQMRRSLGTVERSRCPRNSPTATSTVLVALVIQTNPTTPKQVRTGTGKFTWL